MGLVPEFKSYLIIGNGRAAKHLVHYFQLLANSTNSEIPFFRWYRDSADPTNQKMLEFMIEKSSHVVLAISDSSIDPFIEANPGLKNKCLIHLSGALETENAFSAHPLMTFGPNLYDLGTYQRMSFVTALGSPAFSELFPHLKNTSHQIPKEKKALYHSLCVLSGNFTSILWQKTFSEFEKLGLPKEILFPYLEQTAANLESNASAALTGPLARKDFVTIDKNLEALNNDPFRFVYQAFVTAALNTPQGDL